MKPALFTIFLSFLVVFGVALNVSAQINNQYQENETLPAQPNRRNLIELLGLSKEQINTLRQINRQYQPPLRQARQAMQAANQALDDAVYQRQNDAVIEMRLKAAQNAHSDWLKARTDSENAIAKILNQNQLLLFRDLRRQNRQTAARNRQLNNQAQPVPRRLNRLQRQIRNNRRPLRRNNL